MNKLLQRILFLSVKISMETNADVFANWSGHTKEMHIRIYRDGWSKKVDPKEIGFYVDEPEAILDAERMVKQLERILNNSKLEVAA